jgi:hypothetical protein
MPFLIIATLSSCGRKEISGRYINENEPNTYLEFDKNNGVSLYHNEKSISHGTYRISKDTHYLSINFVSGETTGYESFILHDDYKSISVFGDSSKISNEYFSSTFIKEKSFWEKHWLKIIIGLFIIGLIQELGEKLSGKKQDSD